MLPAGYVTAPSDAHASKCPNAGLVAGCYSSTCRREVDAGLRMDEQLILVCDDNQDNRVVFSAALEHAGFSVLLASDGAQGVELARGFQPSLIVMDLMMPGTNGWQAIARLRADPLTRGIPVIAASADVHAAKDALSQAGFCAFIPKPILPRHLIRAVQECLQHVAAGGVGAWFTLSGDGVARRE